MICRLTQLGMRVSGEAFARAAAGGALVVVAKGGSVIGILPVGEPDVGDGFARLPLSSSTAARAGTVSSGRLVSRDGGVLAELTAGRIGSAASFQIDSLVLEEGQTIEPEDLLINFGGGDAR